MKKLLIVLVLIAALGGGWYFWQSRQPQGDGVLTLQGNVDLRQVSLAFEGSGRVREVRVEEGDRVEPGQVLAVLDTKTLRLQAEQARAQIGVNEQQLLQLRNGARPQEIAQARSKLRAAQADAVNARQNYRRMQEIANNSSGRAISAQDVDQARTTWQVAQSNVNQARDALQLLEQGTRAEEIGAAEAQLESARAQLALLQHQIDLGELRAPVAAVVRSRLLEPGDMASAQKPVLALALTQHKWIRLYVDEPDLGRVKEGMAACVQTDARPAQHVPGTVGYISSVAEFTPKAVQTTELRTSLVYELRVRVDDGAEVLRLGQPVTVRLTACAR